MNDNGGKYYNLIYAKYRYNLFIFSPQPTFLFMFGAFFLLQGLKKEREGHNFSPLNIAAVFLEAGAMVEHFVKATLITLKLQGQQVSFGGNRYDRKMDQEAFRPGLWEPGNEPGL